MRTLISLLLIVMITNHAFGDVFIVTSNAASGQGSLADAMQQANRNGTNTKDIILFNLPYANRAGRTISLSAPLPALSSNLIIDGSTQPGNAFGVSGAKVEIDYAGNGHDSDLFHAVNGSYIEMYGLYLKGSSGALYAVRFSAVSHVVFGAAGKGNIINGFVHALYSKESETESRDFIIQSNLFGTSEDGTDAGSDLVSNAVDITNVKDILLGGDEPGNGNVICGKLNTVNINFNTRGTPGYLKIYNNKIGTDISGFHKIEPATNGTINVFGVNENDYDNGLQTGTTSLRIEMFDNVIANRINLFKIRDTFFIKRNYFGVATDELTNIGSQFTSALFIQECKEGRIGGSEADKNFFANSQTAILEAYTGNTTISHNSFRCNTAAAIRLYGWAYFRQQPYIYITSLSATAIAGKALPGSVVDVYQNDDCGAICEGKTLIASVITDNDGNWKYTGIAGKDVLATATDTYGATSEFSKATINDINTEIINATCGKDNGSISHIQIISGTSWHWEDDKGAIVGYDSNLYDVKPGKYRIVVDVGTATCLFKSNYYEVGNTALPQSSPDVTVANVNCGQATGSLSMPSVPGFSAFWFVSDNILVDTGFAVSGFLPAKYFLKLSSITDTTCQQNYGPYEVINESGGSLDVSDIVITNANCNSRNGSISHIRSTSLSYWKWENDKGNTVATGTPVLLGVPAGKYRLKAKGNDNCDTIVTAFYTIRNENEILIDSSGMQLTGSSRCATSGAITGINAINGETYNWQDETGKKAGNEKDAHDLAPGYYTLTVSNASHCSAVSLPVHIPLVANTDWQNISINNKPSDCSTINGFIHVTGVNNASSYQYKWIDPTQSNVTLSTSLILDPVKEGSYILLAKDGNDCEDTIVQTVVAVSTPLPIIREENSVVKNEICHGKNGSITGITIDSGTQPFNLVWKDGEQSVVSTNAEAQNLSAGKYRLIINDGAGCMDSSQLFAVNNNVISYKTPVYKDLLIQRHSSAFLQPVFFQEGTYSLTDSALPRMPALQNTTGIFTTAILDEDKTFYITVSSGDCESDISVVHIRMADETKVQVPGAFTPNGDGTNDKLKINVIGIFLLNDFIVYDRSGHIVFRTKDISTGWDGNSSGKPLKTGTYIWMISGKDGFGKSIVVKGTTVLMR